MAAWNEFHTNPRKSYYLFLRQGYRCPAHVAHAAVKRIDRMIAELQQGTSEPAPSSIAAAVEGGRGALTPRRTFLARVWDALRTGRAITSG